MAQNPLAPVGFQKGVSFRRHYSNKVSFFSVGLFCRVLVHLTPQGTKHLAGGLTIILASGGWPTFGHKSYLVMRFATSYFHNTLQFITIHLNPSGNQFSPWEFVMLLGKKLITKKISGRSEIWNTAIYPFLQHHVVSCRPGTREKMLCSSHPKLDRYSKLYQRCSSHLSSMGQLDPHKNNSFKNHRGIRREYGLGPSLIRKRSAKLVGLRDMLLYSRVLETRGHHRSLSKKFVIPNQG